MATNTSKMTNVQALAALIAHAEATGFENGEALGKMRHHLAQLSKPKPKSDLPSKTQRLNAQLVEQVYEFMCERESVTTKSVIDQLGSPYITTPQKASILLGMLVEDGRALRDTVKGRAVWTAVK